MKNIRVGSIVQHVYSQDIGVVLASHERYPYSSWKASWKVYWFKHKAGWSRAAAALKVLVP